MSKISTDSMTTPTSGAATSRKGKSGAPSVAIVIVVWNGKADTLECLESLSHDTYPNRDIIVVDNGSSDGSSEEIARAFPDTIVLKTGQNLGFTGGNNVGIQHANKMGADYVYLLNNDTTVEPDALEALVATAESQPTAGLLAPIIFEYYPPRPIWFAGSKMDLQRGAAWHDNSHVPEPTEAPYEIPWATGCAMLIRTRLMQELGGFDDRYYLSSEDVDLCVRVRKSGLRVLAVPAARIYHKGGRSGLRMSGIHFYYTVRNTLLLLRKHSGLAYFRSGPALIATYLWRSVRARPDAGLRLECIRSVFHAVVDHLSQRYGPYHSASVRSNETPVASITHSEYRTKTL